MPRDDELLREIGALRAAIQALPAKLADAIEEKVVRFLGWIFKVWCYCALVYLAFWILRKWFFKSS